MEWNPRSEQKYQAVARLRLEGRYDAFVEAKKGISGDADEKFYGALKKFPPSDPSAPPVNIPYGNIARGLGHLEKKTGHSAEYKVPTFREFPDWQELHDAVELGRTADAYEVARWVADRMATGPSEIDPASVPSRGALVMLFNVQNEPGGYDKFIRDVLTKTMPKQSQIDAAAKSHDDNRPILSRLEAFEAEQRKLRGGAA